MNKKSKLSIVLIAVFLCATQPLCAQTVSEKSMTLMVDYKNGEAIYTVNGTVPAKSEGLLLALSKARALDKNPNPEATLLVNESIKLSEVGNLIAILSKAEYYNYKLFVFGADKQWMSQLTYSPAIKFSPMSERGANSRKNKE